MSDTSKATPKLWEVVVKIGMHDKNCVKAIGPIETDHCHWCGNILSVDEEVARDIAKAVASHNPQRDRLARELAEMVIAGAGCNLSDCACGGSLTDFARRLLKLYEEEKP